MFGGLAITFVQLGSEEDGPLVGLTALPGDHAPAPAPAHGHASDNFRIQLLGDLTMGRETYRPGEFRFQDGWKPYPNEGMWASDGFWGLVMMADKRGFRRRLVKELPPGSDEEAMEIGMHRHVATTFGFGGDALFPDDPTDTAGPSALASTLGRTTNSGKLNGSFADREQWMTVSPNTQIVVALMGEPTSGPVVVLSASKPDQVVTPRCCFDTEVFRLVVAGSCNIEGQVFELGDMRTQRAGTWSEPVVAGSDGLQEVLVLGDRRHVEPSVETETWLSALGGIVADLTGELTARPLAQNASN
jgi:hypothetical protein